MKNLCGECIYYNKKCLCNNINTTDICADRGPKDICNNNPFSSIIKSKPHENIKINSTYDIGIKYTEDGLLDYETYAETRRKPKDTK